MGKTFNQSSNQRLVSSHYYDRDIGTQRYGGPKDYRTANSSVVNGVATIDPSIRAMNEQLMSRYLGNENNYTKALVDPLREEYARRQGGLQRSLSMRNIAGSSFGDQALTNLSTEAGQKIGNAQALAENQNLQALSGLQRDKLQQELAALGLSQQQIAQQIALFESEQGRDMQRVNDIRDTAVARHNIVRGWAYGWSGGGKGGGSN